MQAYKISYSLRDKANCRRFPPKTLRNPLNRGSFVAFLDVRSRTVLHVAMPWWALLALARAEEAVLLQRPSPWEHLRNFALSEAGVEQIGGVG